MEKKAFFKIYSSNQPTISYMVIFKNKYNLIKKERKKITDYKKYIIKLFRL